MRHAPWGWHMCGRPWCLRRRGKILRKIPECDVHYQRSLPARNKLMEETAARAVPVQIDPKWRPSNGTHVYGEDDG